MLFQSMKLHNRLIIPLSLCMFIIVAIALSFLYQGISNQISNLSGTNIKHIQNFAKSNANQLNDVLDANLVVPIRLAELGARFGSRFFLNIDSFFNKYGNSYSHLLNYSLWGRFM